MTYYFKKYGWFLVRTKGFHLSIQLMYLDQVRIPKYSRAAPWVGGGLRQASTTWAWVQLQKLVGF